MRKSLILSALLALCLQVSCLEAAPSPGVAVGLAAGTGEWDSGPQYCPFVFYDADAKTYRMFYAAGSRAETNESMWGFRMIGEKVSKDATSWTPVDASRSPVLFTRKYLQGEILNPYEQAMQFDSVYAISPCVIKDGPLYKMWYTGWGGEVENAGNGKQTQINFRIGYATSKDAIHWTKVKGAAGAGSVVGLGAKGKPGVVRAPFAASFRSPQGIPLYNSNDDWRSAGKPSVLKESSRYRMWYEGFDGRTWRILYAFSTDGIKWTKTGPQLESETFVFRSSQELARRSARNPVVFRRNGQYELWYQGISSSQSASHVLRRTSKDGASWSLPEEVILHPPTPAAGGEDMHIDSILVLPDNSCQVFYSKENSTNGQTSEGVYVVKRYSMYTEVVNP